MNVEIGGRWIILGGMVAAQSESEFTRNRPPQLWLDSEVGWGLWNGHQLLVRRWDRQCWFPTLYPSLSPFFLPARACQILGEKVKLLTMSPIYLFPLVLDLSWPPLPIHFLHGYLLIGMCIKHYWRLWGQNSDQERSGVCPLDHTGQSIRDI